MLDTTDAIIAVSAAGTALITSLANGIVLVIKAVRDNRINTAVSTDIVHLARNGGTTPQGELATPKLVAPTPPAPGPVDPAVSGTPAGPAG